MSATLLETQKSQMSVIFPQEPAKVKVHPLPKKAERITYNVNEDMIRLSAWMPDGFYRINQERSMTDDDFYEIHCEGCHRNCHSFLDEYVDENGDVDWDNDDLQGHCGVYDDGYHGQYCPEGHEKEDTNIDFYVGNMVFEIYLSHLGNTERFARVGDTAYLCKSEVNDDGTLMSTENGMASNVFGTHRYPEGICWGYNNKPDNLREIVSEYFTTPFNNDLTPIEIFEENSNHIRNSHPVIHLPKETLLSEDADALLMIDAAQNVAAFFQLLCAGFKSLRNAPHIMFVPLKECEIQKNGSTFTGYQTIGDAVNRNWFVTHDGLLVGQV